MEEDKRDWSTPVSKSSKKGKKKTPQAVVSAISVDEDWDLSQYEDKGGKLPIHPVAVLDDEILDLLQPIFQMTRFLGYHFGRRATEAGRYVAPSENIELMYAAIFCFKVIGSCVDRATTELIKQKKPIPLHWKQLINLRNALTHHLLEETLSPAALKFLEIIIKDSGQIFAYFDTICKSKNTFIDTGGKKLYKRFHDVVEFATLLREECPRESRYRTDPQIQSKYLNLIRKVIRNLSMFSEGIILTQQGMSELLEERNNVKYYALQNCLEYIATLTTPSEKYRILTSKARAELLAGSQEVEMSLNILGETRNAAIHEHPGIIAPRKFRDNVVNLRKVYAMQSTPNVSDKASAVVSSTAKIIQGTVASPNPAAPPKDKGKQAVSPQFTKKSGIMAKAALIKAPEPTAPKQAQKVEKKESGKKNELKKAPPKLGGGW